MTVIQKNNRNIAIIEPEMTIGSTQDLLDLFATARYSLDSSDIIIFKESLDDTFFDLKSGVAGELLQKCSNYRIRFAVVGDFSIYTSKSLKDFIYESNKGNLVFFKDDITSAVDALSK